MNFRALCVLVLLSGIGVLGRAQEPDPHCPAYPESLRSQWGAALERDHSLQAFAQAARARRGATPSASVAIPLPRTNFIDNILFDRMVSDQITPAPTTTDAEFLRRVSVDLTGRIPQPEKAAAFLADDASDKRARFTEELLSSDAYVSQFTLYYSNRFRVGRGYPSSVRLVGRNLFHKYLRDAVARDRPLNEFAQEMLSASGDPDTVPGVNYFVRYFSQLQGNPQQDFWDDMTDYVTTQFLGFRTACISCHNGRGHLENINLYLTPKKRAQFWDTSAFFARTSFFMQGEQDFGGYRYLLQDRSYGNYTGAVPLSNPGNRPQRGGANVTNPAFLLTGEHPATTNWRAELMKMTTSNRQFARAQVNYLWAYFFGTGIVDPPDGWDLRRTDPANPPPGAWPMQNSQPELLEALTDAFISSNYSTKAMARLIVSSSVYQLSSRYPTAQWQAAFASDFARHSPRRLSAEELWDAIAIATQTEQPMNIAGFPAPVLYANQLPDTYEPWENSNVTNFLSTMGRGNWTTIERDSSPTLLGLLFLMNQWDVYQRTAEPTGASTPINRAARVALQPIPDEEAVRQIYLATLTRYPTDAEVAAVLAQRGTNQRFIWLPRLQWSLVNKLDFIFDN